ncbi:helix-turn-helix domain-containing protein [Actinoallomurus spadix]|uniref:Helix-turn-helix transcriptional regulator n=1 Tax=Actinoallomurus spadix TaxID=79912 RepID=A0ABN0XGS3_9ACTN|nr:helix-turn-helix transcriptional regulator [Actinoallomurus spadix]MCO5987713.1 helix-turn-helix domain-containing protein [Actinoallomurus spadix]
MARPQRDLAPDSLIGHFGLEIRTYRNGAGLSQSQLADALGCTGQWVGAVELADKAPSEAFAQDLDTYFRTNGSFHRLWKTIKRARQHTAIPPWFKQWVGIEQKARILRSWEPLVVPGLLQTPAYAHAMLAGKPGLPREEVEKQVTARIGRQQILMTDKSTLLWVVMDESVLRRLVGSPQTMREQLSALIKAAHLNNVTVQIAPSDTGETSGLSGAFVIATIDGEDDAVYLDDATEGRVTTESSEVSDVINRYDAIRSQALPARASLDLISKVIEERWTQA